MAHIACLKLQLPAALRSHMLIAAAGTTLLIAAVVVGTALLSKVLE